MTRTLTMTRTQAAGFLNDLDATARRRSPRNGMTLYETCGAEVRVTPTPAGYTVEITEP